jgi:hypothetical protein
MEGARDARLSSEFWVQRGARDCLDFSANYARRTTAPQGAAHQSTVSLVTLATVDSRFAP